MSTAYIKYTYGPWLCDDTNVLCDGVMQNGVLVGAPTVDGVGAEQESALRKHRRDRTVLLGAVSSFVDPHGEFDR